MVLSNKYILFGLPCFRNSNKLTFEIENGEKVQKIIKKILMKKIFLYDSDADNATYKFIDNCIIYTYSFVQAKFREKIETAISKLEKENLL